MLIKNVYQCTLQKNVMLYKTVASLKWPQEGTSYCCLKFACCFFSINTQMQSPSGNFSLAFCCPIRWHGLHAGYINAASLPFLSIRGRIGTRESNKNLYYCPQEITNNAAFLCSRLGIYLTLI